MWLGEAVGVDEALRAVGAVWAVRAGRWGRRGFGHTLEASKYFMKTYITRTKGRRR